jgi:hypothetical protein
MPKGYPLDLVGQQFGRWTVIGKSDVRTNNQVKWLTRCACGNESFVPTLNLRSGKSTQCRSCGLRNRRRHPGKGKRGE